MIHPPRWASLWILVLAVACPWRPSMCVDAVKGIHVRCSLLDGFYEDLSTCFSLYRSPYNSWEGPDDLCIYRPSTSDLYDHAVAEYFPASTSDGISAMLYVTVPSPGMPASFTDVTGPLFSVERELDPNGGGLGGPSSSARYPVGGSAPPPPIALRGSRGNLTASDSVFYAMLDAGRPMCVADLMLLDTYQNMLISAAASTALDYDQQYHIACVYNGRNLVLYVDGVVVANVSAEGVVNSLTSSVIYLGAGSMHTPITNSTDSEPAIYEDAYFIMSELTDSLITEFLNADNSDDLTASINVLSTNFHSTNSSGIFTAQYKDPTAITASIASDSPFYFPPEVSLYYDGGYGTECSMTYSKISDGLKVTFLRAGTFYIQASAANFYYCDVSYGSVWVFGLEPSLDSATPVNPVTVGTSLVLALAIDGFPAPLVSVVEHFANGTNKTISSSSKQVSYMLGSNATFADQSRRFVVSASNSNGQKTWNVTIPIVAAASSGGGGGGDAQAGSGDSGLDTASFAGVLVGSILGGVLVLCGLCCMCCTVGLILVVAVVVAAAIFFVVLLVAGVVLLLALVVVGGSFAGLSVVGVRRLVRRLRGVGITFSELVEAEVSFDADKPLGCGAFGEQYRGSWHSVDVVVEILTETPAALTENDLIDLRLEATFCEKVGGHANVCKFVGAVTADCARVVFVYDFQRFGTLHDLLFKRKKSFQPKIMSRFCGDIASGLMCLHTDGVVHGMLTLRACRVTTDFRVVLCSVRTQALPFLPHSSESAGAPDCLQHLDYCAQRNVAKSLGTVAPEVLAGAAPTAASDMYSLGVVALEVLSLTRVFKNVSASQIAKALRAGNVPEIPSSVPPDWAAVLSRCLSVDPDDRPTMAEVMEMLGADGSGSGEDPSAMEMSSMGSKESGASVPAQPGGAPASLRSEYRRPTNATAMDDPAFAD